MKFVKSEISTYFNWGPIFNKSLEVGVQRTKEKGFDFYWRFSTRGDHAGLHSFIEAFGLMFEFNLHDVRHWDYDNDTWQRTQTEEEYEASKLEHCG